MPDLYSKRRLTPSVSAPAALEALIVGAGRPIDDGELRALFGDILAGPIALAVSGGGDSMALMGLMSRAIQVLDLDADIGGRRRVVVMTVDHRLRPESFAEAAFVKSQAERLGFAHRTLTWHEPKPESGVQAAARDARYGLMAAAILEEENAGGAVRRLVTAHHADDQAETVLMRLQRGSGVRGLAGMRPRSCSRGIVVLRPLLQMPKSRLAVTLEALGVPSIEDPSNLNSQFERIRVRAAAPLLASIGIENAKLALSAMRLARADAALEALTDQLAVAAEVDRHRGAYASLDLEKFRAGPDEARIRLLARLIDFNGGESEEPQLAQIESLDANILSRMESATTLGGTIVRWRPSPGKLQIFREAGRHSLPCIPIAEGHSIMWDERFRVSLTGASENSIEHGQITVQALGVAAYATMRPKLKHLLPSLAASTLPALVQAGKVIAVPYFTPVSFCNVAVMDRSNTHCVEETNGPRT